MGQTSLTAVVKTHSENEVNECERVFGHCRGEPAAGCYLSVGAI